MAQKFCNECQENFDESEMVTYGEEYVCSACKDTFFQKIKEGVLTGTDMEFKGFWIRFAAVFLDGILMQIVTMVLGGVAGFIVGSALSSNPEAAAGVSMVIGLVVGLLIPATYEIMMIGKGGSTLG